MAQVYIEGWELLMLPLKAPTGEKNLCICYCPNTHPPTQHDVYIPKHLQPRGTMQVLLKFPVLKFPDIIIDVDDQFQHTNNAKGLCCLCCSIITTFRM